MRRFLYFVFMSFCLINSVAAASPTQEYTLKNGLHLLVKADHRAPVAIFQIWYRVGGSYEHNGTTGISHVVEHMMFEGSKHYPEEMFDKVVAINGGQSNAFTTDDYTVYFEEFAADKIALSFKLESDRIQYALLTNKAFKKEIQVVMEERRMRYGDQPSMLLYERLRAAAFLSNPYHHLTIGWMGDLKQLTAQDVRAWYHRWYVPNNATIVIVGDVKPAAMLALAKKYFSPIAKRPLPNQKSLVAQKPVGSRIVNVALPAKVPYLFMAYNVPTLKTAKVKWHPYALDVLAGILAGSDSSRLSRSLVRKQQLASSIAVNYDDGARFNTIFTLYGIPTKQNSLAQLRKAITMQLQQLQTKPINVVELNRVKTEVIASKIYAQDSLAAQATQLGGFISVGLPWKLANTYVQQINKVTIAQVRAVAKEFLQTRSLTVGMLHPLPMTEAERAKKSSTAALNTNGVS